MFICLHNKCCQVNIFERYKVIIMAFILIIVFLVFAVLLRTVTQRLRTGDFGLRAASFGAPLIEVIPGALFIMSFANALVLTTLGELGYIQPVTKFPYFLEWVFFIIGLCGVVITIISQQQMGDLWRIGVDQTEVTSLKTNGLYARSRNPIYFGILLFWIGLSGTFQHPLLWLCMLVCWVCIETIVRKIEEPYLEKLHGDTFKEYIKNTNRYLLM